MQAGGARMDGMRTEVGPITIGVERMLGIVMMGRNLAVASMPMSLHWA